MRQEFIGAYCPLSRQEHRRNLRRKNYQLRQARLTAARKLGRHTFEQWKQVLRDYHGRCAHCNGTADYEFGIYLTEDHIIPISKGGSDAIDNIRPLCNKCNPRLGNRGGA